MSELTQKANSLICAWEDAGLEITLISFLVLEYHVSTEDHATRSDVLMELYGFTSEQLDECYAELEFQGYAIDKGEFVSITSKSKKILKAKVNRMTQEEKKLLEHNFSRFWSVFPRKVGKKKALFEWMKLRPDNNLTEHIILSITKQIKWKKQQEIKGAFVPEFQDGERWIKNERYNDEVTLNTNFINIKSKPERDER
jgi:hypothetical protein